MQKKRKKAAPRKQPARKPPAKKQRLRQLKAGERIPKTGRVIGYKQVDAELSVGGRTVKAILKLEIRGKRTNLPTKNRCESVKVLAVVAHFTRGWDWGKHKMAYTKLPIPKTARQKIYFSQWAGPACTYEVGGITRARTFDNDMDVQCGGGIHFYRTPLQAKRHI